MKSSGGLRLLPEIAQKVAALKLLHLTPLCLDRRESPFPGTGSLFARDRGRSLKRFHRPHRFNVWLHEFQREDQITGQFRAIIPVTLNAGLMKPRKGFTPGAGEKTEGVQLCRRNFATDLDRVQSYIVMWGGEP